MIQLQPHTITQLLLGWRDGDQSAIRELFPLVYKDLHDRAKSMMSRERPGHVLQATALINEVYIHLTSAKQLNCENRDDFFAVCGNLMRQVLVDIARSMAASRRGGGLLLVSLDEALETSGDNPLDLMALNDALYTLDQLSPRQCRIVELRYFGGLSIEQTAEALKISPKTVMRDWKLAKVWLFRELNRSGNDS